MKVYLACPWKHRHEAHDTAKMLRANGVTVVSRWHDEWLDQDTKDPLRLREEAQKDFDDVKACDVVMVLNLCVSEGKAVEQGIALACGKLVILVGERSNVFHYLDEVKVVESVGVGIRVAGAILHSRAMAALHNQKVSEK